MVPYLGSLLGHGQALEVLNVGTWMNDVLVREILCWFIDMSISLMLERPSNSSPFSCWLMKLWSSRSVVRLPKLEKAPGANLLIAMAVRLRVWRCGDSCKEANVVFVTVFNPVILQLKSSVFRCRSPENICSVISRNAVFAMHRCSNWTKWWKERSSIIGKDEVWLLISAFCRLSCLRFPNPRKVSLVRCLSELCSRDKLSSLGNHWKVPSAIFVIVLLLRSSTVMLVLSRPWKVVFERETCWVFLRESFCKAVPASSSQRLVVNWRLILL